MTETIQILEWWASPARFFKDIFHIDAYPYQEKVITDIKNVDINRIMITAAGGTGKTQLIAVIALFSAIVFPTIFETKGYRVIILGGSEDQARIVYSYILDALKASPILKEMVDGEPLQTITKFKNGSTIKALAKSFKSIYGQHGDLVIVDEAVEAGDFVIRDSFRIIAESKYSRIILSTTPHDFTSLFVDMWMDKKNYPEWLPEVKEVGSWKRYQWSAMDCPSITTERVQEAKKTLPEWMFQVYWLGEPFPLIGTMIPLDKVREATKDMPIFNYQQDGARPILGFDWGFYPNPGAGILVQKQEEYWVVLKYKLFYKEHPDKVLDWIEQNARDYKVSSIYVDSSSISEYLRLMDRGLPVYPIKFKTDKFLMQSNLLNIFEKGLIKIPEDFIPLIKQLKKYTYETKIDEDLVDALMLALRQIEQKTSDIYYRIAKPYSLEEIRRKQAKEGIFNQGLV